MVVPGNITSAGVGRRKPADPRRRRAVAGARTTCWQHYPEAERPPSLPGAAGSRLPYRCPRDSRPRSARWPSCSARSRSCWRIWWAGRAGRRGRCWRRCARSRSPGWWSRGRGGCFGGCECGTSQGAGLHPEGAQRPKDLLRGDRTPADQVPLSLRSLGMRWGPASRIDFPHVHLYLHVPFCARRCSYCDFAIAVRRDVPSDAYAEAVLREWSDWQHHEIWNGRHGAGHGLLRRRHALAHHPGGDRSDSRARSRPTGRSRPAPKSRSRPTRTT